MTYLKQTHIILALVMAVLAVMSHCEEQQQQQQDKAPANDGLKVGDISNEAVDDLMAEIEKEERMEKVLGSFRTGFTKDNVKKMLMYRKKQAGERRRAALNSGERSAIASQENQLDEVRQLLTSSGNSPRRQQLLRMIADAVKARSNDCPPTLPAGFCKQPLTFFLWLKEVRNQEKEKQMYDAVKSLIVQMFQQKRKI